MFIADLPNPYNSGEWKDVGYFDTREKALAFLLENWGLISAVANDFITEIEDEGEDFPARDAH